MFETSERLENPIDLNDRYSVKQTNERLIRESIEAEKRRKAETVKRKKEWLELDEALKVCAVCLLPLDAVTKAKISENPMLTKRQHSFCSGFEFEPGVVRGLVALLSEAYLDDPIPLQHLQECIEQWKRQSGLCSVSKIKMEFPVEEEEAKPREFNSSVLSAMENHQLQREHEREQEKLRRLGELHQPIADFDTDGRLRFVSRTVYRMKEGLSETEFAEMIRVLYGQVGRVLPESRSFNPVGVGRMTQRSFR